MDDNQKVVVKKLRQIPGVSVAITSALGKGFVDLVIGFKGQNFLVELKDGNKVQSQRKLSADEQEFQDKWKGQYTVCKSFEEILELLNGKSKETGKAA